MDIITKLSKLEQEAQQFGFCWENSQQIMEQIHSECQEVEAHLKDRDPTKLQDEIGDLLHAVYSLCLFCKLDPTETLANSVDKFSRRFELVKELASKQGLQNLTGQSFKNLMQLWDQAKVLDSQK